MDGEHEPEKKTECERTGNEEQWGRDRAQVGEVDGGDRQLTRSEDDDEAPGDGKQECWSGKTRTTTRERRAFRIA